VGISAESIDQEFRDLVHINNDVISLLREMKGVLRIVLCSNAGASFLRRVLKDNNIEEVFDEIIISSEIGLAKPDEAFFKETLRILDRQAGDVIFVDDNEENVKAAQSLGIDSHVFASFEDIKFLKSYSVRRD
jgi:putative hydrolase of the HAD superfamily